MVVKECNTGKRCYDKRGAESAKNRLMPNRGRGNRAEKVRIYPCRICAYWHLTKQPRRAKSVARQPCDR